MSENSSHIPVFSRALNLEHDQRGGFQTNSHHVDLASVQLLTVYFNGHSVVGRAENSEHDLVIAALIYNVAKIYNDLSIQSRQTDSLLIFKEHIKNHFII